MSEATTTVANWSLAGSELHGLEGWTGSVRPTPPAGYYEARWTGVTADSKGFSIDLILRDEGDPLVDGYTLKEFYTLFPERKANETDDALAKRTASNRGKFKGFLQLFVGDDYLDQVPAWTPEVLGQFQKQVEEVPVYLAFATPPEGALIPDRKGGTPRKPYPEATLMSHADWEKLRAIGQPPKFRGQTMDGAALASMQTEAALPGSVTRMAAGAAPVVVGNANPAFTGVPVAGPAPSLPAGLGGAGLPPMPGRRA